MNNLTNKNIDIFDMLGSTDLYNSYNEFLYFDTYNLYPNIYKKIGKYIYDNYINNSDNNKIIQLKKVKQICEEIFEYLNKEKKYEKDATILLKDCIMIIVLVELERNNYKIQA